METVIRVALIYVFVFVGLRLLGKREFSQLSAIDLVTLLLVPEIVSQAITRDDYSLTNAFVAVATLFCLVFITSALAHRFRKVDRIVNGEPTLLVAHGKLLAKNCDRERISPDEIFNEMHHHGIDTLDAVRWAILEVDGRISIVLEKKN